MIKKIFSFIKKVIFFSFLLYGYNLIAQPLQIIIPINYITIGALTIFGAPALLSFIVIFVLVF